MSIEDFGEKIGGAKKETWKKRGLTLHDTETMNDRERTKYITKNNIWLKPNYQEMVNQGVSKRVVCYIKMVRDSLPTKPYNINVQNDYINTIVDIKETVMQIKDDQELSIFYKTKIEGNFLIYNPAGRYLTLIESARGTINNKVVRALQDTSFLTLDREITKRQFCYTPEEKVLAPYGFDKFDNNHSFSVNYDNVVVLEKKTSFGRYYMYPTNELITLDNWIEDTFYISKGTSIVANNFSTLEEAQSFVLEKNRNEVTEKLVRRSKERFIPKQLEGIERDGKNYRQNIDSTGNDFLEIFDFKSGEFGNWLNKNDRQESLNYAFDALKDLGSVLGIDDKNLALNGELSIAFGARGGGAALAHYESLRKVINLTKINGAGSLAHEWAHALDDFLGGYYGCDGFITSNLFKIEKLPEIKELIQCMKYSENKRTDYYINSIKLDDEFSKTDSRYWQSTEEMFARAFACYVYDKLGFNSDYLCGQANLVITEDGTIGFPLGEEREKINKCFDMLFYKIKDIGLFSEREKDFDVKKLENYQEVERENYYQYEQQELDL